MIIIDKEKLCTLMVRDMASIKNITEGLILNGYIIEVEPVQKEYPRTGIEYFALTIYCTEIDMPQPPKRK